MDKLIHRRAVPQIRLGRQGQTSLVGFFICAAGGVDTFGFDVTIQLHGQVVIDILDRDGAIAGFPRTRSWSESHRWRPHPGLKSPPASRRRIHHPCWLTPHGNTTLDDHLNEPDQVELAGEGGGEHEVRA